MPPPAYLAACQKKKASRKQKRELKEGKKKKEKESRERVFFKSNLILLRLANLNDFKLLLAVFLSFLSERPLSCAERDNPVSSVTKTVRYGEYCCTGQKYL
jgi:hypothetical protein